MAKSTQRLFMAMALAGLTLVLGPTTVRGEEKPTILLKITDLAGVAENLPRAMTQAETVFRGIGVRVVWSDVAQDGPACDCRGVKLSVRLLSPFLVREMTRRGVKESVLGTASAPDALAYIYTERVLTSAERRRMDPGILLGLVIAHEMGHLLMKGGAHSRTGLMAEGIDTDPLGLKPSFTPAEGKAIRAFVQQSMVAAPLTVAAAPLR